MLKGKDDLRWNSAKVGWTFYKRIEWKKQLEVNGKVRYNALFFILF